MNESYREQGRYSAVIELFHKINADSPADKLRKDVLDLQAFSMPIIKELARMEADLSGDDRTLFESDIELN